MLKNISKLELKVGERFYQFMCESDSPLIDVKEVLFQFQKYIGQIEDVIKAQQEQKSSEENKKEENSVEHKIESIG